MAVLSIPANTFALISFPFWIAFHQDINAMLSDNRDSRHTVFPQK